MIKLFGLVIVALGLAVPVGLVVVCAYEVMRKRKRR